MPTRRRCLWWRWGYFLCGMDALKPAGVAGGVDFMRIAGALGQADRRSRRPDRPAGSADAKGFRIFAIYAAALICAEGALLTATHWVFGLRLLFLWIVEIPSRHPWRSVWSTVLDGANRMLLRENLAALTVLVTAVALRAAVRSGRNLPATPRSLLERPWALFALAGLLFWPMSMPGYAKVGSSISSLSYSTWFFNVGLALLAV